MNTYHPHPICTDPIVLPPELNPLLERLAKNAHDVWAEERLRDGWTFGDTRNDQRKEHPCLIAYEELPESEKEYDRPTVSQTLKAVLALGWSLQPPVSECDKD